MVMNKAPKHENKKPNVNISARFKSINAKIGIAVKPTNSAVQTKSLPPELFQKETQKIKSVIININTAGKGNNRRANIPPKIIADTIIAKTEISFFTGSLGFPLLRNFATKTGIIKAKGQLTPKAIAMASTTPTTSRHRLISCGLSFVLNCCSLFKIR